MATGLGFADALSASGIAGVYGAPLLLTAPNSLSAGVADEIKRLGATDVIIVGGASAVSDQVKTQLAAVSGVTLTERLSGSDRYKTSAAVATRIAQDMDTGFSGMAFLVCGNNFADALAASPLAYGNACPILLTDSKTLSTATAGAIHTLGITDVVIAGGTSAVSTTVLNSVKTLTGSTPQRVSGANRYETAAALAQFGLNEGFCIPDFVGVATGADFPDALGGGIAAGYNYGVLLMTPTASLSSVWEPFLTNDCGPNTQVQVFGGTKAVSNTVKSQSDAILGGAL